MVAETKRTTTGGGRHIHQALVGAFHRVNDHDCEIIIYLREVKMDISRRLGILVFCGVPAIIGGGIVYAIFGSLTPMWIYEALLLVVAGALVSR